VGDRFLFAARDAQGVNLWEIAVSSKTGRVTGKARRVTEQMARTRQAARAGGKLLFSTLDENRHIWDVPVNGVDRDWQARQITWATRQDGGPSVAADGKRMVFSGDDAGGRRSVWTKDLASGREVQLSGDLDVKLYPQLSRDGSTVAFSTEKDGKRTVWLTSTEAKSGPPKRLCESCV
jgi:Tol biopolymer transport system component